MTEEQAHDEGQQASADRELIRAVLMNDASGVQLALERGANPSVAGNNEDTPLHFAIWQRRWAALDVLWKARPDPAAANYKGDTPLHHVFRRLDEENGLAWARRLLEGGADALALNHKGELPHARLAETSWSMTAFEEAARLLASHAGQDQELAWQLWGRRDDHGHSASSRMARDEDARRALIDRNLLAVRIERVTDAIPETQVAPRRRL